MAIKVRFVSGDEQQYDAATACLADGGALFVLYKQRGQKLESAETFRADQVVWAIKANGDLVLGAGLARGEDGH